MRTTHFFHTSSLHWRPIMCQHLSMFFVVEHVEPTNYIYIYTTRYYKSYLGRRIYPTPKEMQDGTSFWERWAEMATPVWFSLPSLLSFWLELSIWMSNPQFLAEFWVQFTAESQESICGVFVALGCCLTVVTLKDSHMLHVWNIYQHLP